MSTEVWAGGWGCLGWGLSSWLLPKLGLCSLLKDARAPPLPPLQYSLSSPWGERAKRSSRMSPTAWLGREPADHRVQFCSWQEINSWHGNGTQAGIEICGVACMRRRGAKGDPGSLLGLLCLPPPTPTCSSQQPGILGWAGQENLLFASNCQPPINS